MAGDGTRGGAASRHLPLVTRRSFVALEQHLRDAGRAAEVAVNLKRRMGVEEVRERVPGQRFDEHLVRVIAVEEARPEIDFPRLAPAGAPVAAKEQ